MRSPNRSSDTTTMGRHIWQEANLEEKWNTFLVTIAEILCVWFSTVKRRRRKRQVTALVRHQLRFLSRISAKIFLGNTPRAKEMISTNLASRVVNARNGLWEKNKMSHWFLVKSLLNFEVVWLCAWYHVRQGHVIQFKYLRPNARSLIAFDLEFGDNAFGRQVR